MGDLAGWGVVVCAGGSFAGTGGCRRSRGLLPVAGVRQVGDDLTRGTGFAPLPVTLQSRLAARFMAVKPQDGKAPDYLTK